MGVVVPFPAARHRGRITKTASYMASISRDHAEKHLSEQLRRLVASLEKKGIEPDTIERERSAYNAAVRAAVWRLIILRGAS
ncbi:DUF6074 family protein [Chelatococcus asaccharovorans]|uniref:Uncharacterized protein n=1 Tax=Chelatococcus asaccharovorans TaxID=28210 RepID=A0A2V3TSI4_9HYPH|nr:hypothetical protein C7450_13014 [Chelatococcus asaccharovorans]